jgi:uncharacterized membrane protein
MKRTILAALLLTAACGQPSDRLSDEDAAAEQGPAVLDADNNDASEAIAGPSDLPEAVDAGPTLYKALGTEPGWSLTVHSARMDYAGDYGQVKIAESTPPDFRAMQGTYRSGKLQVTISPGPCSDGMSDLTYRQTVRVTADGRTVSGCGGGTISANTLAGTNWSVVAVNGKPVTGAGDFHVRFSGKALDARFGCNAMGGEYRLNGDHLTVGDLQQTLMGCPEPSATFEREAGVFLRSNIRVEKVGGDKLRLVSEAGAIELKRAN